MKKHVRFAIALVAACTAGFPAAAAEPTPRTPTKPWTVDFDERHCLASRQYGSPEKPFILAFKPSPVGNILQMVVAWKDQGGSVVDKPVSITFDNGAALNARLLAITSKATGIRTARINLPLDAVAPMRNAAKLSLVSGDEVNDTFALSDMKALMVELDRCLVDLQGYWNIEEAAAARLRSRPKANIAKLLHDNDYPKLALERDASGTVQLVMLVNEAGRVVDCTVTETSSVPALDAQSCAVVTTRARFEPAIGADGKPARSSVVTKIRWIIPDD